MKNQEKLFTMPRTSLCSPICAAASEEVLSLDIQQSRMEETNKYYHSAIWVSNFTPNAREYGLSKAFQNFVRNTIKAILARTVWQLPGSYQIKPRQGYAIHYIAFRPTLGFKFASFNYVVRHINFNMMPFYRVGNCNAKRYDSAKSMLSTQLGRKNNYRSSFYHFRDNKSCIITQDNLPGMRRAFDRHFGVLPNSREIASEAFA